MRQVRLVSLKLLRAGVQKNTSPVLGRIVFGELICDRCKCGVRASESCVTVFDEPMLELHVRHHAMVHNAIHSGVHNVEHLTALPNNCCSPSGKLMWCVGAAFNGPAAVYDAMPCLLSGC